MIKVKIILKAGARLISLLIIAALIIFLIWPLPSHRLGNKGSIRVFSKEGFLLREFSSPSSGAYGLWQDFDRFPEFIIRTVITAEDKRFFYHPGFDPFAMMRSAYLNVKEGKIISGGSTITQQLVRVTYDDVLPANRYLKKIAEILFAFRVEVNSSKNEILEAYLNSVPMKFNQSGLPAGARRIFGRDIELVSEREGIALAVLIRENQSSKENFEKRFASLMMKVSGKEDGDLSDIVEKVFSTEKSSYRDSLSKTLHFEDFIKSVKVSASGDIETSISGNLNNEISEIISAELNFLQPHRVENCSVIVLKLPEKKGEELKLAAMIGSENFHSSSSGQVNGSVAIRQAGSTLKPFVYGYAMDHLGLRSYSIINDEPIAISIEGGGTYSPKNNDLKFWGPLTLREALACSRNVPAVFMVNRIGVNQFYKFLNISGFTHLNREPSFYGPGIVLGTGGASLLQLCRAYSAIASGGNLYPLYIGKDSDGDIVLGREDRLFSEESAYRLTHILSDREARRRAFGTRNFLDFPFQVAAKTGTSKDCRDAWTVGFTSRYVVGVWVGNFSGETMDNVSGAWGAGRIFQQVIRHVTGRENPVFNMPDNFRMVKICRATGLEAGMGCRYFMEPLEFDETLNGKCSGCAGSGAYTSSSLGEEEAEIISPAMGESFVIDPTIPLKNQQIPVVIFLSNRSGTSGNYSYSINNNNAMPLKGTVKTVIDPVRGENRIRIYCNGEIVKSSFFMVE